MQSIGERLEEARKRKGISIREAAEATKIRGDYLHKFESNQYDIRLPEIYVRGFLRSYSNFLKLPSDKIIADYNALHQGETKASRSVNREVYGRMDISTSKEKEAAAGHTGGTTPPMPGVAAQPAEVAPASRNPATFVPPHSTGSPIDKKLLLKIGAIAGIVILAVILIVVLLSGGGSSSSRRASEAWPVAQPNEPAITIASKGAPVTVKVTSKMPQANGSVVTYFQGTISPGQSRVIPRREELRVESPQYAGVQFIIDGKTYDMTVAIVDIKAP